MSGLPSLLKKEPQVIEQPQVIELEQPEEPVSDTTLTKEPVIAPFSSGITAIKVNESYLHSGWRPMFCWLSIITLFYFILIRPIANFFLLMKGLPLLDGIDPTVLETLLYSLTGFGIARTVDKVNKKI
jgi:hypothetical protein